MRKILLKFGVVAIISLCLYLLAWPVALKPQAWIAPKNVGFTDVFAPNETLANLQHLSLGGRHGPEDVVARMTEDGLRLYVSSKEGDILELDPKADNYRVFAQTGGAPLGLEFDREGDLIVADAYRGLLSVKPSGAVTVLTDKVGRTPILYADDVDIGPDGTIYFTDASTKFGAEAADSLMAGSVQEIFEHARTGRILAYDPNTQETVVIAAGFSFPNGIAVEPDGESLLFVETGEYRLMRLFLSGSHLGQVEAVLENLPGFPDNINLAPALSDGTTTYFIGLESPRHALLDKLSGKPFVRKMIWRLSSIMPPKGTEYGHLIRVDGQGRVIKSWQDPSGAYPNVTGAIEVNGVLYVSALEVPTLGYKYFED